MSEQKRYTAQGMRDTAQCLHYNSPTKLTIEAAAMLRQAADAEEENAQLKARLEAVVKELEDMRKYCAFAYVDPEDFDDILREARGEGGAE